MKDLKGTSAIVTGGAVRIGRAICERLAKLGVNICVHYGSSHEAANQLVTSLQTCGVQATSISADLSEPFTAADTVFEHANQSLGRISILVNSAAIFEKGSLLETDESNWDRHQNINLKAPFALAQKFAEQLNEDKGSILNIVDWRGERPVPGHLSYTVSKAGLITQTRLLAQELGPQIQVNGIAPGAILPAPGESESDFLSKGDLNPLRITGSPDDIADAAQYLLQSEFITGEIINVTAGQQL